MMHKRGMYLLTCSIHYVYTVHIDILFTTRLVLSEIVDYDKAGESFVQV